MTSAKYIKFDLLPECHTRVIKPFAVNLQCLYVLQIDVYPLQNKTVALHIANPYRGPPPLQKPQCGCPLCHPPSERKTSIKVMLLKVSGKTKFKLVNVYSQTITHPGLKHIFCAQLSQSRSDSRENT